MYKKLLFFDELKNLYFNNVNKKISDIKSHFFFGSVMEHALVQGPTHGAVQATRYYYNHPIIGTSQKLTQKNIVPSTQRPAQLVQDSPLEADAPPEGPSSTR